MVHFFIGIYLASIIVCLAAPGKQPKGYICHYDDDDERPSRGSYKKFNRYEEDYDEQEDEPIIKRLPPGGKFRTGRNGEVWYVVRPARTRPTKTRPSKPKPRPDYLSHMIEDQDHQSEYLIEDLGFEQQTKESPKPKKIQKISIEQSEETPKRFSEPDEENNEKQQKPTRPQTRPVATTEQMDYGSCEECVGCKELEQEEENKSK